MDLLPISALQHLLYCERQCALIHLEQAWAENQFTVEGNVMHEKAHDGPDETKAGIRIVRGLPVKSETLGLSGQCDVVEFHPDGTILPIEYKRGKPKAHRADEVQLCAQALCLEATLAQPIPEGRLFYGQTRRRMDVPFDDTLRALTADTAQRLHAMIAARQTPPANYEQRKCDACSLKDLCMPQAMRFQKGAQAWFARQMAELVPIVAISAPRTDQREIASHRMPEGCSEAKANEPGPQDLPETSSQFYHPTAVEPPQAPHAKRDSSFP